MEKDSFVIQTFTMNADVREDRIRLDTVSTDGGLRSVHFTRRLTDRFIPAMATKAEGTVRAGLPKELALSMEQEALRSRRDANPLPAVPPPADAQAYLCQTIHLSDREDGTLWIQTDDATFEAHMVLGAEALRAVLDVFLITYRALEWSEQAFPDWVRERGKVQAPSPSSLN